MKRPFLNSIVAFIFGIFLSKNTLGIAIVAISFILCEITYYLSKKREKVNVLGKYSYKFILILFVCMFFGYIYSFGFNYFKYNEIAKFENKEVEIIGNIKNEGINKQTYWEYVLKNNVVNGEHIKSDILLKTKEKLIWGNKIITNAIVEIPQKARNSNGFDYSEYLKTKNIYIIAKPEKIFILNEDNLGIIERISFFVRKKVREFTKANLDIVNAGILNALIIGDESDISADLEDNYKKSGMLHLLVVSGGHTVFLIMLLKAISTYIGISKNNSKYLYIFVIFLYIFITGATPSILRAGIGIIIVIFSELIGRQNDGATTIGLVAFILLIINPNTLFSLSFLLSFGGVIGIMICYPKIRCKLKRLPGIVAEPLALTLAAQIFVTPITIYSFNVLYFGGIISNIFTLSLSGFIMMGGIILFVVYLIIPPLVSFPMKIVSICISLMNNIAAFFSDIEWLTQYTITPSMFSIVVYYAILIYVFLEHKKAEEQDGQLAIVKYSKIFSFIYGNLKSTIVVCGVISILILNAKLIDFDKSLKISMIDIGHGDSILITTPNNKYILIDTGDKYYQGNEQIDSGEQTIVPYLLKHGIRDIEWLILTHMDSDHIGGYESIAKVIDINNLGLSINSAKKEEYANIRDISKKEGINIRALKRGDKFVVDGIYIDILYPKKKNEILEENNDSIVLLMKYKDSKALFMGDLEKEGEEELLKLEKDIDVDILKVGHHGSNTSSTYEFIKRTEPQIALISVGNRFKSIPGKEVLNNLSSVDSKVYRTDKHGEINVIINENKIDIKTTY